MKSVPDSNLQSQPWDGSSPKQHNQPTPRRWPGSVSKMQWIRQLQIRILWPGNLRNRCVAPAPAGKFLLGSNPSFCFSPLVIMFLASVLCFLACKRLFQVLCLLSPEESYEFGVTLSPAEEVKRSHVWWLARVQIPSDWWARDLNPDFWLYVLCHVNHITLPVTYIDGDTTRLTTIFHTISTKRQGNIWSNER